MSDIALVMTSPFHEGDLLTSSQFLKRWQGMPALKQAELTEGVVYCMASPVSYSHSSAQRDMILWLSHYMDAIPGCESGLDMTWVMGPANVPQRDVCLRILPEYGGQASEAGDYGKGASELIVEVSGSTLSRDLGAKLELYRAAGVRECITVLLEPRQVIWRQLARGRYRNMEPPQDRLLCSLKIPGLWLDPVALWAKKKPIRAAVERGVKTPEHAALVKHLAHAAGRAY